MTVDLLSGNVTHILVEKKTFTVIKHIHASLILFGRGTHVFLVRDQDGNHHILKDAWLLKDHGISEVTVLSKIHDVLKADNSPEAKKYRMLHSRYIVGEELNDSTSDRRGRMIDKPPTRVHRRVVTGPVGDPLTSFRSRKEFVQVMLDCVDWLDFLHNKCNLVHGDLSPNNIVIFRDPSDRPPPRSTKSRKGSTSGTSRATRSSTRHGGASIKPAPTSGVNDNIPAVGTIIDYDYARPVGTVLERTSGTLPFMPLDALNIDNRGKYIHSPAHDLEALLQTMLGIVTFTDGPYEARVQSDDVHVPLARWHNEGDREQLFKDKSFDVSHFDRDVGAYLMPYWQPLVPYLRSLVAATWTGTNCTSHATHEAYRTILCDALEGLKKFPEVPAMYARTITKRSRSSDNDEAGRWPYKFGRGNGPGSERLPRPAFVKQLSAWKDSVDA
ncbi:hypothetical protein HYPSUDRAFT_141584 [Hypholoma sublateritium FD-334 SS-4]|uniref:Protein kinase domain-containing protein n=1 Tax=Hypholoma sublateritium (strain FD-334 SS-4) TaxID=945553 RepID=A0A0D2MBK5_HYPSF|nr:hypothetical protein HYPSUDRAFT_141584 [Hypholoma sublateritium FD-334 SS-4]